MTTSSSERGRCTRISPSAVLDDRLEGKDLEWALDHLKICDVCRDRVDEFREIAVRVDRLPVAAVPPAVLRDAYTWAIPEGLRTDPDPDLALGAMETAVVAAEPRPEPTRFERPRWEPRPREVPPPVSPGVIADEPSPPPPAPPPPLPTQALFPLEEEMAAPVHEVTLDSHREETWPRAEEKVAEASPPLEPDERREARVATMTRVSVGLVAAVCVLLAGFLYADGGLLTAFRGRPAASHAASASPRSSPAASVKPTRAPSPSPSLAPTPSAAAAIATLGDGVAGGQVFRIRLGTADPRFSRLVFDMNAQGLPAMTITQPDPQHLVVTFKDTTGAGTPVGGLRTARLAAVEPAVQQGSDLVFTVDLARAVQVKAFTLTGPPRLVIDLY
jgi:hypothetical protein